MKKYKVAVIVGSLRKESYNLKTAQTLMSLASDDLAFELIEIGSLPFFNEDLEDKQPQQWIDFREQIQAADAVLFLTPEYNRSIPAALKNALDVGSRPYGQSAWSGKPAAVVSVAIGALGGFGANHHLRQSLTFLNMPAMAQPEAYIGNAGQLFDDQGSMINESTKNFLQGFMDAYEVWVKSLAK